MRKIVITILMLNLFILTVKAQGNSITDIITDHKIKTNENLKDAETKSVFITSLKKGMSICSGSVLENSVSGAVILTAKHCIGMTKEMYVESILVTSIQVSTADDLALLRTKRMIPNKRPAILGSNNTKVGEELYGIGYPNMEPYIMKGTIILHSSDDHFAKMTVISGCSGGGLYDKYQQLTGVVWGRNKELSIYVPLSGIKKFLDEVNSIY